MILTAQDRCDRCGAAALVAVSVADSPLLFCAHHYRMHADALADLPILADERERLVDTDA